MINALLKKLSVKPDKSLLILNAPSDYLSLLKPIPTNINIYFSVLAFADVIQIFIKNGTELVIEMENLQSFLNPETTLWVTYPKKASGIATDLGMMHHWDELKKFKLRPVASISINQNWTALQIKPENQVKKSETSKAEINKTAYADYINQEKRTVKLPEDLLEALKNEPHTVSFFESLSFTNKKEYAVYILSAKQLKTREERVKKAAQKLNLAKKNPAEK
jgi:Bacteriocin-protection, YdeI or OmpD-Associated